MHTPGPWYLVENPTRYEWEIRTAADDPGTYLAGIVGSEATAETDAANARLIAAAPELLQALDDCITNENCTAIATCDVAYMIRRFKVINEIARTAIRTAKGD